MSKRKFYLPSEEGTEATGNKKKKAEGDLVPNYWLRSLTDRDGVSKPEHSKFLFNNRSQSTNSPSNQLLEHFSAPGNCDSTVTRFDASARIKPIKLQPLTEPTSQNSLQVTEDRSDDKRSTTKGDTYSTRTGSIGGARTKKIKTMETVDQNKLVIDKSVVWRPNISEEYTQKCYASTNYGVEHGYLWTLRDKLPDICPWVGSLQEKKNNEGENEYGPISSGSPS